MRTALTLFLVAAASSLAAQTPATPVQEKVDVNVVLVDATVTERSGHQILGLDKEDFVVKDNGAPQEIASVDYFTNRRLLDSPEAQAKFKVERVREERYFILFFDKSLDLPYLPGTILRAARSARKFVDTQLQPKDRVAIAGFDSRLKIYTDFSSDHALLKKGLDQVVLFSQGLKPSSSDAPDSLLANLDWNRASSHVGNMYEALETLAEGSRGVHARKSLVVFSPGVWEANNQLSPAESPDYDPMLRALESENIRVDTINLLQELELQSDPDTMNRVASETGGRYFRQTVNFDIPLQQIENENSGYYLISFYAKKGSAPGSFHHLDVSLRNPEFKVRARRGYVE